MADLWIPGFEKRPISFRAGGKYDRTTPKKVLLHTTEGGTLDGAYSAYKKYPPHIGVDFYTKRRWQHVPLNRSSYSLKGSENEDEPVIQVEIVGFAKATQNWTDRMLDWLASDVMIPIHNLWPYSWTGPPQGFHGAHEGIYPYIASANSPIRFSRTGFEQFSGIVGHQHAPSPDTHWDPGAFPIARLIKHMHAHQTVKDDAMTPAERAEFKKLQDHVANLEADLATVASAVDRTTSPYEQVQASYLRWLDRKADDGGLKFWANEITIGKQSIISLGRSLRASAEYRRKNP